MKKGFTLIELLVVVLIIGVLAAIALPMYQKAVLKSRFAALMPIVKAMNDSNEAYYLEHGQYASNPQDLPVQGQLEYPTGTTLEFGQNMDYAYVLASNPDARNNYIMYQKHSANYPGEIHCEAVTGDELAESICASFGNGNEIGTTLTDGYTTYIIEGIGAGMPAGADDNTLSCDKATQMGYSCNMTTNTDGKQVKKICRDLAGEKVCRTKIYNEDGNYTSTTCKANSAEECTARMYTVTYDANGNKIKVSQLCETVASDGSCTSYNPYAPNSTFTYDTNGNLLSQRNCQTFAADGSCSAYYSSPSYDYTYDANGNKIKEEYCYAASDGSCNSYQYHWTYDYDADGKLISKRNCTSFEADGSCSGYSQSSNNYDYTYNGDVQVQRSCKTVESDGTCSEYKDFAYYNTYDTNGNLTFQLNCDVAAPEGSCGTVNPYTPGYEYVYDAAGQQIVQRNCKTVNAEGTACSQYSAVYDFVYDDNGKQIAQYNCMQANINQSTGECIVHTTVDPQSN